MAGEEFYHGWLIQVVEGPTGYLFQCWIADHTIGVTDNQLYPTPERAVCAGRRRADLESMRLSLIDFLNGNLHRLLLNTDERMALARSISQYIDAAS